MDQSSMAERAQNEADTSDLDASPHPSSSTRDHRPGPSEVHRHSKSRHHSVSTPRDVSRHHSVSHPHDMSHHQGGSHHLGAAPDFPDNASSRHSHLSRSATLAPPRGIIPSHHSSDEVFFDGSGTRRSRSRHRSVSRHRSEARRPSEAPRPGESGRHSESRRQSESDRPGESRRQSESRRHSEARRLSESGRQSEARRPSESRRRSESRRHSESRHSGEHQHRRSRQHSEVPGLRGLHHQAEPHDHRESSYDSGAYLRAGPRPSDASDHRGRHHPRTRQHRRSLHQGDTESLHSFRGSRHPAERHRGSSSQASGPLEPRSVGTDARAGQPSAALGPTPSRSAWYPHATQSAHKGFPQDSSSKTAENWAEEDERFQRHKTSRGQRPRKKLHNVGFFGRLWERLCHLLQELRDMLRKLTESLVFEAFIFFIVCLNAIMLVTQTFAEVKVRGEWFLEALDSIFLSIYMVEALLKIIAMGFEYFSDSWNNLDFFIVIMAVLDFMVIQLKSNSFNRVVSNQNVFLIFKVFKNLRALRAIRVLQRFSFLTSLQEVIGTLVRSLPSIAAILILMFTCLLLFSVVFRALFHQSDPKHFQNIFTTIFTLFTLLTLDDWSLIYLESRAQGAWYIIPILMIYIIIQYYIFLNLVIAVLVDNFQMALLRGLEKEKQEKAAQINEKLLDESLTELSRTEPEEAISEHSKWKHLIEKKFGTMTEKQQEQLFHFLQLMAGVEHFQQKFRSQASVLDEIVDTAFEAGEEDFRK